MEIKLLLQIFYDDGPAADDEDEDYDNDEDGDDNAIQEISLVFMKKQKMELKPILINILRRQCGGIRKQQPPKVGQLTIHMTNHAMHS